MSELVTEVGGSESGSGFSGEALEGLPSGAPVYVHRVSGKLGLAESGAQIDRATVVGLARAATATGFMGDVDEEGSIHEESDWTAIAGAAALAPGQEYYLDSVPGRITSIPPETDPIFFVRVGTAVSPTKLEVRVQPPIQL